MLRGVNQRIVEINECDSSCFSKAILYLKPECFDLPAEKLSGQAKEFIRTLELKNGIHEGYLRSKRRADKKKIVKLCIFAATFIALMATTLIICEFSGLLN